MKKLAIFCFLMSCTAWTMAAEKLPDNMYFKAMKKEMDRSLNKLHQPGVPKLFYMAYKLENTVALPYISASLGALDAPVQLDDRLSAYVWVAVGSAKKSSMGYRHDALYAPNNYSPRWWRNTAKSYEGIRQALWMLTNRAYTFAAETYQQKQAYKRTKAEKFDKPLPDFIPQVQSSYVEQMPPFPSFDEKAVSTQIQAASARGKEYSFLEDFTVAFSPHYKQYYYLNNLGGFYQYYRAFICVEWQAKFRNKDGHKKEFAARLFLPATLPENFPNWLQKNNEDILNELNDMYTAQEGKAYIGPVILFARAASKFVSEILVDNLQNTSLVESNDSAQKDSGKLIDSTGIRIAAPHLFVYDQPLRKMHLSGPLVGFTPIDDEGVTSQELNLIQEGKLIDLPLSSTPNNEKYKHSNGHAIASKNSLPRERLTNVWVTSEKALSEEQIKDLFLKNCRDWGLEYCYVIHDLNKDGTIPLAHRIYTNADKIEYVYGLKVNDLTARSLRDVQALGSDEQVFNFPFKNESNFPPTQSIIIPSLLLEEMELVPDQTRPDKPPFVKKP